MADRESRYVIASLLSSEQRRTGLRLLTVVAAKDIQQVSVSSTSIRMIALRPVGRRWLA